MTILFYDGFSKYGPVVQTPGANMGSTFYSARLAALMAGEWTTIVGSPWIDQSLVGPGTCLAIPTSAGNANYVDKTFPAAQSRIKGGFFFKMSTTNPGNMIFALYDGTNKQAAIGFNATGQVTLTNAAGAIIETSAAYAANSVHWIAFDITFGSAGAYAIYFDGQLFASGGTGTSNFKLSTNASANRVFIGTTSGNALMNSFWQHLWLGDSAAPLITTGPIVETSAMASDSAAAFAAGGMIFGDWDIRANITNSPGANQLFLRKFTPSQSGSLASVSCNPSVTAATAKFKAVVYTDNAGVPNALLATGNEVVGTGTAAYNNNVTSAFAAPPALTSGTPYWIGFITDTSVALTVSNTATTTGVRAANTYTSGPPGAAPVMTTNQTDWLIWGMLTGVASHTAVMAQNPSGEIGDFNYVQSSNVGDEDLYNAAVLSGAPASIYSAAVKGFIKDSAAGARTVTLNMKSGAVDAANAGVQPGTTPQWFAGYFETDPNTGAAWTPVGLNAAPDGYKITA